MTIGSQGLKAVAGLALAAIVFAGLASCSAAVLPDGAREVPDLMVSSPSVSAGAPAAGTTFTLSDTEVGKVVELAEQQPVGDSEPWRVLLRGGGDDAARATT